MNKSIINELVLNVSLHINHIIHNSNRSRQTKNQSKTSYCLKCHIIFANIKKKNYKSINLLIISARNLMHNLQYS